jgi:hypothetical protein
MYTVEVYGGFDRALERARQMVQVGRRVLGVDTYILDRRNEAGMHVIRVQFRTKDPRKVGFLRAMYNITSVDLLAHDMRGKDNGS